jgi:hypothetical protein
MFQMEEEMAVTLTDFASEDKVYAKRKEFYGRLKAALQDGPRQLVDFSLQEVFGTEPLAEPKRTPTGTRSGSSPDADKKDSDGGVSQLEEVTMAALRFPTRENSIDFRGALLTSTLGG